MSLTISNRSLDQASELNTDVSMLTPNAQRVLQARYLKKDERGDCIESASEMFRRVARTMADIERKYSASASDCSEWEDAFYGIMTRGEFMPNSPTLMNSGREMGMLSACFVLPVKDSIDEILNRSNTPH